MPSLLRLVSVISVTVCLVAAAPLGAQVRAPRKRLLVIGEEKGYRHEAVTHAMVTIERLGKETGLWDTVIRTDTEALTKKKLEYNAKNLDNFDAVVFYTGGTLEMDASQQTDFLSFVHDDGKGFIGIHSATITFTKWPAYGEMIGGYFDEHPWGTFAAPVIVEDPAFPGMKQWPSAFTIDDERGVEGVPGVLVVVAAEHLAVVRPLRERDRGAVDPDEPLALVTHERQEVGLLLIVHRRRAAGVEQHRVEVVQVLGVVFQLPLRQRLGIGADHGIPQTAVAPETFDGDHRVRHRFVAIALLIANDQNPLARWSGGLRENGGGENRRQACADREAQHHLTRSIAA